MQFRKLHLDPVQQQYEYPPVETDHLPDSGHFSLVMHFERIMNSSLLRVKTLFFVTQTSNSEQTVSWFLDKYYLWFLWERYLIVCAWCPLQWRHPRFYSRRVEEASFAIFDFEGKCLVRLLFHHSLPFDSIWCCIKKHSSCSFYRFWFWNGDDELVVESVYSWRTQCLVYIMYF